jgi:hypothetical protein
MGFSGREFDTHESAVAARARTGGTAEHRPKPQLNDPGEFE